MGLHQILCSKTKHVVLVNINQLEVTLMPPKCCSVGSMSIDSLRLTLCPMIACFIWAWLPSDSRSFPQLKTVKNWLFVRWCCLSNWIARYHLNTWLLLSDCSLLLLNYFSKQSMGCKTNSPWCGVSNTGRGCASACTKLTWIPGCLSKYIYFNQYDRRKKGFHFPDTSH